MLGDAVPARPASVDLGSLRCSQERPATSHLDLRFLRREVNNRFQKTKESVSACREWSLLGRRPVATEVERQSIRSWFPSPAKLRNPTSCLRSAGNALPTAKIQ